MSNLEDRFNAPKVPGEPAEKKTSKKRSKIEISAPANDNAKFGNDPVDAIADKDIEGWTKSLEEKPAKKRKPREKKTSQPTPKNTEWKVSVGNETYNVGPIEGGNLTYGIPTPKTEARLNRNVDRDFKEAFEDEMKKSAEPELAPEFDEAFEEELFISSSLEKLKEMAKETSEQYLEVWAQMHEDAAAGKLKPLKEYGEETPHNIKVYEIVSRPVSERGNADRIEIAKIFSDELTRRRLGTWEGQVANLTAEVKRTAEDPKHGKNPTESERFDAEDAFPIMKDQDDALDELAKKNKMPQNRKKGWFARWLGL